MNSNVAVLGAGAWGTAIAKVIAENNNTVVMCCRKQDQAEQINTNHTNSKYLPQVTLPKNISASTNVFDTVNGKDFLILATPSLYLIDAVKSILDVPSIQNGKTMIGIITKGFLQSTKAVSVQQSDCEVKLITDVLSEILPPSYARSLVYICGPSHAQEVAAGKITGLISACRRPSLAVRFKYLLKSKHLLVFSSLDVKGVQTAAAVKNVVAIAFGILDALKNRNTEMFGDNSESLLLAAGLNEIQKIGMALGATHPETFTSIAGVGDLDVTCRSVYGRNRRLGREIIEKNILDQFSNIDDIITNIDKIPYTPEGAVAAKYVKILQQHFSLRMPICNLVYRVLNKEEDSESALNHYMNSLL
ncbi:MAG: NAD(P)H-dependent glycerol-3-phosphate dehydrogenase [Termitinemataceae bacterium]|nr:MAG: NAD(P)H-dependent glycerol-3-phosphate dehydrogenase [Termitinemataceae bacterium]